MVKTYARHVSPIDMINYRHAWKIDDNHYKVYGREADPYVVFVVVENGVVKIIGCPCHIGSFGEPCFHKAVVVRRLLREGIIYG